jgi:hypothetical protein
MAAPETLMIMTNLQRITLGQVVMKSLHRTSVHEIRQVMAAPPDLLPPQHEIMGCLPQPDMTVAMDALIADQMMHMPGKNHMQDNHTRLRAALEHMG